MLVVITFAPPGEVRQAIDQTLAPLAELVYLPDLEPGARGPALGRADAVLVWFIGGELVEEEFPLLGSAGLVQLLSAGADSVPFELIPEGVPVASNAGAYAEPMAEHVLAMALSLAKRLPQNHAALARGEFDQEAPTREIRGALVGVLGFGGIGQASARLFRALDARIFAVNRSGRVDDGADRAGTLDDLDAVLAASDILVISLPLSRSTRGLIGRRELSLMKPDAILINVARAAILDEDAIYEHLRDNPGFSAGIDTWWREPHHGAAFATRRPFFGLPNLVGSPHNSGITPGSLGVGGRHAAENIARHLRGEPVQHLVDRSDYVASAVGSDQQPTSRAGRAG